MTGVAEARLRAVLLVVYPTIDTWEDQGVIGTVTAQMEEILDAADAVMFSDESVSRSYPFVYSFLKRRGLVPVGKEVQSLVGYVVTGLRGGYDG